MEIKFAKFLKCHERETSRTYLRITRPSLPTALKSELFSSLKVGESISFRPWGRKGRGGGRSSRRKRKKTFSPFSLLPRSAYCEEEGGGEGEESGLLGRKISFPLSGGGRKGKGPSLLPTLKSDHGKASKLNENGERRVGGPPPWRKFEEERGTLWETAVCGWLQYWMGGRRCGWKSDRLCHLSLLVQRGGIQ